LAQALNGNFASLTRTGFVLDEYTKKTIKEGTETERAAALVKVLNSTYKDFNANLRNTDAGKMQVLANTAREVQTIIGTGIIDSLKILSEDTTIDGLTEKMKSLATATSNASVGFSLMLKDIKDELSRDPILGPFFGWLLEDMTTGLLPLDAAINRGKERQEQLSYNKNEHKAKQQILAIDNKADKLTKSQLAAQKKLLSTQQKIAAEKKKQEILDKASLVLAQGQKVFDEEGIQLAAAAQGKLTEEEKTRLALKTDIFNLEAAINEGNVTAAAQLANSMVGNAQKLAALRTDMIGLNDIQNPFTMWLETLKQMAIELSKLANVKPAAVTQQEQLASVLSFGEALKSKQQGLLERTDPNTDPLTALRLTAENLKAQQQGLLQSIGGTYAQSSMIGGGTIVNLNVQGSVTTERDLVAAITQGLYAQQASGTPVNYSTVY